MAGKSELDTDVSKRDVLTQNARVDKMEETEVFEEIILDGSAREEDAARGSQLGQCCVCLVLTVLQSMTLHTDTQTVMMNIYVPAQ